MRIMNEEAVRQRREDELIASFTDEDLAELKPQVMAMPMIVGLPEFAKKLVVNKSIRQSRLLRSALAAMLESASEAMGKR